MVGIWPFFLIKDNPNLSLLFCGFSIVVIDMCAKAICVILRGYTGRATTSAQLQKAEKIRTKSCSNPFPVAHHIVHPVCTVMFVLSDLISDSK